MNSGESGKQISKMLQKNNSSVPSLRELILSDPNRFERFSRKYKGLLLDFSRVAIDEAGLQQLLDIAGQADVAGKRHRMFTGEVINHTEQRSVMHQLWRSRDFRSHLPEDEAIECEQAVDQLHRLANAFQKGRLPDVADSRITDIIHIGIGGSLIGPRLLCDALPRQKEAPAVHFLSSVDAFDREQLLQRLQPVSTAVIVVSKSFTTGEVLSHARRIMNWLGGTLDSAEVSHRLFAVTSVPSRAEELGVPAGNTLAMGEWTGGRFSVWSPVGLTVAALAGPEAFDEFCAGGEAMDAHFREAPDADNLPLIHGLLSCWHRNACAYSSRGLIPYDSRLRGLPAWLQQLQMESNGKSVSNSGQPVGWGTSPIVLGDTGTDAQHALFQAFHQGTEVVPLDFIGVVRAAHEDQRAHDELLANLLAQATALALGRTEAETIEMMRAESKSPEQIESLLPHRQMPGNRPSLLLMLDELSPRNLGALLAFYEHSVFVESVVWDINAFDQWGVELGKVLADQILSVMEQEQITGSSSLSSLQGVLTYLRETRNKPE